MKAQNICAFPGLPSILLYGRMEGKEEILRKENDMPYQPVRAGRERMKRLLVLLAALCLLAAAAGADSEITENCIDLYLPSDPDVGSWECTVEDEDLIGIRSNFYPDIHELGLIGTDGAEWFHVQGRKPGTTALRLRYINSFTLRADLTLVYRLTVDEKLNVFIWGFEMLEAEHSPRGEIRSFFFSVGGYEDLRTYSLRVNEAGEWRKETNGGGEETVPETFSGELTRLVERYDAVSWNGFNETAEGVLDGEDFVLSIVWENEYGIHAAGSNAFPENYSDFRQAVERLFRD